MRHRFSTPTGTLLLAMLGCACSGAQALTPASCPPAGFTRDTLLELRAKQFQLEDRSRIQNLAVALLACLDDPDPAIRDGVAFEALQNWMRGNQILPATAVGILNALQPRLVSKERDRQGFGKPFAALALAEVARMDRIAPFLGEAQRVELSNTAAAYMRSIDDYRGFDDRQGWRHGVAHTADLFMQLALNGNVSKPLLQTHLSAVAAQIAPANHSYIYGEPVRLATAVFWTAQRNLFTTEEWNAWFNRVADPAPLKSWREAFGSQLALARRHNTLGFLQALYTLVQENGSGETQAALLPALRAALDAVW
jgi:hypothetical protein